MVVVGWFDREVRRRRSPNGQRSRNHDSQFQEETDFLGLLMGSDCLFNQLKKLFIVQTLVIFPKCKLITFKLEMASKAVGERGAGLTDLMIVSVLKSSWIARASAEAFAGRESRDALYASRIVS